MERDDPLCRLYEGSDASSGWARAYSGVQDQRGHRRRRRTLCGERGGRTFGVHRTLRARRRGLLRGRHSGGEQPRTKHAIGVRTALDVLGVDRGDSDDTYGPEARRLQPTVFAVRSALKRSPYMIGVRTALLLCDVDFDVGGLRLPLRAMDM
ncbi:MAG: hypothetical protein ABEH58_02205 [Haloplanus sp.]